MVGSFEDEAELNAGAVYVFARSLASDGVTVSWTEETKLYASDGATGNGFGKAISLHGDTALITHSTGAVYIFTRSYGSDGIKTLFLGMKRRRLTRPLMTVLRYRYTAIQLLLELLGMTI